MNDTPDPARIESELPELTVDLDVVEHTSRWTADARDWALHGKDPRRLADRSAVAEMHRCAQHGHRPGPFDLAYLAASQARLRAAHRRRLAGLAALVTVAIVATSGDVLLLRATDRQRTDVEMALLADRLHDLRLNDPSLAAQLALAVHRAIPSPDTRTRLLASAAGPLAVPLTGPTAASTAAAWSADGRVLAVGSRDRSVRLWTAASTGPDTTGITAIGPVLTGAADVNQLTFSPDGRRLAAGHRDGSVRVWDVSHPTGGIPAPTVLAGQHGGNLALGFTDDSSALIAIALDLTVQRWDAATGTPVITRLPAIGSLSTLTSISAAAVATDGRTIVIASGPTMHVVTLPANGTPGTTLKPLTWDGQEVTQLAVSPGNGLITAGSRTGWVSLWRPPALDTDGTSLAFRRFHDQEIRALAFTADGSRLASGSRDGAATVWDISNPAHLTGTAGPFQAGIGCVWGLAFAPGGDHVLAATDDVRPRLWSLPTALLSRPEPVRALAWSPDGSNLATADGSAVRLWTVQSAGTSPAPRGDLLPGTSSTVKTLTWSRDGHLLAVGDNTTVHLWDVHDPDRPAALSTISLPAGHWLGAMAVSSDRARLFVGDLGGTIYNWRIDNASTPVALPPITTGRNWSVNAFAISPDGRILAAVAGNVLYVWELPGLGDTPSPAVVTDVSTDDVRALAFHPDGRTLATGADDTMIRLWDVSAPSRPLARGLPMLGHREQVTALTFSPDGTTLVSGSRDMSLRWWDVTRPDQARTQGDPVDVHTAPITALTYRPDGRVLASADLDRTVRLWDLDEARAARRICAAAAGALDPERWDLSTSQTPYTPPCGP